MHYHYFVKTRTLSYISKIVELQLPVRLLFIDTLLRVKSVKVSKLRDFWLQVYCKKKMSPRTTDLSQKRHFEEDCQHASFEFMELWRKDRSDFLFLDVLIYVRGESWS